MLKAILFDLDGTLYLGKTAIKGAEGVIEQLRKKGLKLFFITNAATQSRKGVVKKLANMGIKTTKNEIYTSGYAAAIYIKNKFPDKTIFCLGEEGLKEEIEEQRLKTTENENAEIVIAGLDRGINYNKLTTAYRAIIKGAIFIATNTDPDFPVENGSLPGSGAIVSAIEGCTEKKPLVIGKPERYFADLVLSENHINKNEALVVGDRIETDIKFAKNAGLKSVLVLTGISNKGHLKKIKEKPDYILESVLCLPELIDKINLSRS